MRSTLSRLSILFWLLAASCGTRLAYAQTPDLVLNPGSSYVEGGRGIPWGSSFNRTYLLVPNSPNASLCIYVVNNNPTNAHAFSINVFQSADSQVPDFTNNQGRYNAVPVLNMPASVAALQMGSGFTQSTAAAKIAVKFSASSALGGNPDTADLFFVQTTAGTCGSASIAVAVQGTAQIGQTAIGNPVEIGGIDQNGLARNVGVWDPNGGSPGGSFPSMMIGGQVNNPNVTFTKKMTPAAIPQGVLAVGVHGVAGTNSTIELQPFIGGGRGTNSCVSVSPGGNCPGYFTYSAGFAQSGSITVTTAGGASAVQLWQSPQDIGALVSCSVNIQVTVNTAGTLTSFLQDSGDASLFNDRMRFADIAAAASNQFGAVATSTGSNPAAYSSGALAASTRVDGPLQAAGRLLFTASGAGASYNVTYSVVCR